MEFDKATIVNLLRSRGDNDQADQAAQELPDKVDHEQHAGLLDKFGIDPQQLLGDVGGLGGLGGLGKELGL